ncbi:MAG: beta-ketoacyl-ACP synthase II [Anaerolineae bacterium]|nr:beta-ketoacyl-ACP synthase II [Anaerolineae bacterium]
MDFTRNGFPRVVITGMGAVSPLGPLPRLWERLKAGESGVRRIVSFDPSHLEVQIAAEVIEFDAGDYLDRKEFRRMGLPARYAVGSALDALKDAGLTVEDLEPISERVAVDFGSALGGQHMAQQAAFNFRTHNRRPGPFALVESIPNIPAHHVSRVLGARGPIICISAACATGTHSLGDAMNLIRYGKADMVVAGGVEAMIYDYGIAGFIAMRGLATGYNDEPARASRPFDLNRNGFIFGEGAGAFILETLEGAVKRDARIYVEVMGMGLSSDAYHVAAPDPTGRGAANAMRWALDDARINPEQIAYINTHGSSTPANDGTETKAIKRVFGDHAYKLAINSTKSMVGHLLGGAGAVEAIAAVMSMCEGVLHPTINYETPDPECDLDCVPNEARDADIVYAMSNNFGLGGQNASVVLGRVN